MVHFFYNFDYDDANDKCRQIGSAATSGKAPLPSARLRKAHSSLPVHIQMYCLADKYDIPGLRTLALEKSKVASSVPKGSWSVLAQATYEINKVKLLESDTSLCDAMVNAWLLSGCAAELVKSHPKSFASLMSAAPWLSIAIHSCTLQSLKYSHAAKQASCVNCKIPAFFTQGVGTVKCKKCNSDSDFKDIGIMKSEVIIR